MIRATSSQAVMAAYSPRAVGPSVRASRTPPRPSAPNSAILNPAVLATVRPTPGHPTNAANPRPRIRAGGTVPPAPLRLGCALRQSAAGGGEAPPPAATDRLDSAGCGRGLR